MLRIIVGIIIFLIGVIYALKTALTIAKSGYDSVPFLDLSNIIKGVALPIPMVVAFLIALVGILVVYGEKRKK